MDNYAIWSLIKPSSLILYCAVLGIILYTNRYGQVLLLSTSTLLVACAFLPIGSLLTVPLESRFQRPPQPLQPDGIIVLAGSEIANLTAAHKEPMLNRSGDRLTTFLRLAHQYPHARLAHAGTGNAHDGISHSDVARQVILGAGIDTRRIVFSNRSRNTCEDSRQAFKDLAPKPEQIWLLVTSAYHMPRAIACFRAVDWHIRPYPTDYMYENAFQLASLPNSLSNIDLASHEWLGLIYYRLKGYTTELFPAP